MTPDASRTTNEMGRLAAAVADRHRLERELGAGGGRLTSPGGFVGTPSYIPRKMNLS